LTSLWRMAELSLADPKLSIFTWPSPFTKILLGRKF